MPITDTNNSIYMNKMFVTGNNATQGSLTTSNVAGTSNTASAVNTVNNTAAATSGTNSANLASTFGEMLTGMLQMNALQSLGSIGDFSDSSSGADNSSSFTSDYSSMLGLGNTSSLFGMSGMDGSSDTSMMLMLIMMLMLQNNSNNSSGNSDSMLNALTGNTANTVNAVNSGTATCQHMAGNGTNTGSMVSQGGASGIPTDSWVVANAPVTNAMGNRSAQAYRAVIDQFDVENNYRYTVNKNGSGDTYCNIFTWDVTRAMGAEVPHYIDSNGVPQAQGGSGIEELNANRVNDWLNQYGTQYGWVKVSAEEAQFYANNGMPAVTSWKNPSGGHGHLQVVSPSADGQYNAERGVTIAQAGRQLKNYDYIDTVYGKNTLGQVEYFVHV